MHVFWKVETASKTTWLITPGDLIATAIELQIVEKDGGLPF
jgi:hypothetical protein